jgi:hypothetical protein
MKVIAVDPSTGKETNNIGQLRFYDLANHQSVLAIETHDQGMVLDDGSVILHGRLPKSVSRGCSLDMETVKKQEPPTSYAPIIHGTYTGSTYLSKSKIEQLLEAFRSLLTLPIHDEYTQGLSLEQFRWGLEQSINALSFNGLETILKKHRSFPKRISIVASYGICSSIIEWVFLSLGAGASVLLKAPSRDHRFHQILCEHLQKYDFPIKCTTTHDLGSPELIYAFGSNQSMDKIQRTHPNTTRFCYGHRFSLIYCSGSPSSASQIAQDLCAYNGRGCMAPVAVCTPKLSTKFIHALEIAIAEHRQTCTAPPIAPSLHPFVRQRIMNTKAIGTLHSRNGTHLCEMPFKHWTQNTLPNLFELHQVSIPELLSQLEPWKNNLSTLGTDLSTSQEVELQAFFPRVVSLGEMQTPVFPRHHDGFPMFMSPSYD